MPVGLGGKVSEATVAGTCSAREDHLMGEHVRPRAHLLPLWACLLVCSMETES